MAQLPASRSGKIDFSGQVTESDALGKIVKSDLVLQWGDSAEVIKKLCGIYLQMPFGVTDYLVGSKGNFEEREIKICVDIDVGLFEVIILFPSQQIGGSVSLEDIKSKYTDKYGEPEKLFDAAKKTVIGYRWVGTDEIVTAGYKGQTDANGVNLGAFPIVFLKNPEMDKKREEAVQRRAAEDERTRKAESSKALDF